MDRSLLLTTYPNLENTLIVLNTLQEEGIPLEKIGTALADGYGAQAVEYVKKTIGTASVVSSVGLGHVITGGILTLTNSMPSLLQKLQQIGIPKIDAEAYAESLRRGYVLVAVQVNPQNMSTERRCLQSVSPISIDQHVKKWRKNGWNGFDPMIDPYTSQELHLRRQFEKRQTLKRVDSSSETTIREYPFVNIQG